MTLRCEICDNVIKQRVLRKCPHNNVCFECHFRCVIISKLNECPICLKKSESPIVVDDLTLNYDTASKKNYKYLSGYDMYVYDEAEVTKIIDELFEYKCICSMKFKQFEEFDEHVKSVHKASTCKICNDSSRFFPRDLCVFKRYVEYKKHIKTHPVCCSCSIRCFDQSLLVTHMNEKHVRCEICAKLHNKVLWFKNIRMLDDHYKKEHFICLICEARGDSLLAFGTRADYNRHMMNIHNQDADYSLPDIKVVEEETDYGEKYSMLNKFLSEKLDRYIGDKHKIDDLLSFSALFTQGEMSPGDFYSKFREIAGDNVNSIFNSMIATLTDPDKRAYLNRLHNNYALPKLPEVEPVPDQLAEGLDKESNGKVSKRGGWVHESDEVEEKKHRKRKKKRTCFIDLEDI